jgi:transcriptional regulator with XRE-family HTH domain
MPRPKTNPRQSPYKRAGDLLGERRASLGLSQEEVALRADVNQSLVSQLERGVHNPASVSLARLLRILDTLGITLRQLLEHLDERSPELEGYLQDERARERAGQSSTLIPLYDESSLAGGVETEPIDSIAIPAKWLSEGRHASYRMTVDNDPSNVIVKSQTTAEIGDLVVAYVPDRGLVTKRVTIDSAEDAKLLQRKKPDIASLIAPGAVIKGKVKEIRKIVTED